MMSREDRPAPRTKQPSWGGLKGVVSQTVFSKESKVIYSCAHATLSTQRVSRAVVSTVTHARIHSFKMKPTSSREFQNTTTPYNNKICMYVCGAHSGYCRRLVDWLVGWLDGWMDGRTD